MQKLPLQEFVESLGIETEVVEFGTLLWKESPTTPRLPIGAAWTRIFVSLPKGTIRIVGSEHQWLSDPRFMLHETAHALCGPRSFEIPECGLSLVWNLLKQRHEGECDIIPRLRAIAHEEAVQEKWMDEHGNLLAHGPHPSWGSITKPMLKAYKKGSLDWLKRFGIHAQMSSNPMSASRGRDPLHLRFA